MRYGRGVADLGRKSFGKNVTAIRHTHFKIRQYTGAGAIWDLRRFVTYRRCDFNEFDEMN